MKSNKVYIWLPLCIGLSIAIGIFIGNLYSGFNSLGGGFFSGNDKLKSIFQYIDKAYVDSVDVNNLVEEAIPNILAGLDPHSTYISAEDMQLSGDELDGHFSGIGVEFMIQNDTITIVSVINGGASEAVGIMPGDRIVTVDDSLFVGKVVSNDKVMRKLRGQKGTIVKLGIKRHSSLDLLDFSVTRADVPVKTVDVSYQIDKGIGYIKISRFGENTYNEFITAISKLKKQGCESFIIDLQQNTGGYLHAANLMVNEFLERGQLIVYTEGRAYPREDSYANGTGTIKTNQLVVLIDESSASASEIFAGAIQDNDRGVVLGRRSYGKGLVQNQHKFKDGSAIRLTIARYHTPSGRCIQKAYERGGLDDYSKDLMNRYLRGEFDNQDSIKVDNLPLFHTLAGRPVYGDDGIMPDVFIPRDTLGQNSYYIRIMNSGALREFAFLYTDNNREKLKSFSKWEDAAKHLEKQPLVDMLATYAEKKEIRRRPYLIEEARRLMQTQLESLIIRNIFGDDGFYPVYQKNDILIKKAVELLKSEKATPKAVASQKYK